ncbi:MAG TPA: cation:proton antiporter [Acidimicrobiia bacterium]|nr:cation:proton antiporter [Acidimicrobiia bacterium]
MHADLIGLGALMLTAGVAARIGRRLSVPAVPLFMAVGILLGPATPGPALIEHPEDLATLASLGLILLLFHLGLEFPVEEVLGGGRRLFIAAGIYIGLNIGAGLSMGWSLGWGTEEALVVAGAMGISSSAIATKLLIETRRLTNAETPVILGVIVIEDLFLAIYLAAIQPILSPVTSAGRLVIDLTMGVVFLIALFALARFGARAVGALVGSDDDELLVLSTVGLVVLVSGVSAEVGVSDAIGALMIGLVVSATRFGERVERLATPLRDVLAAVFFVAFGMTIEVEALSDVALPAMLAVVITVAVNSVSGVAVARLFGFNQLSAANIGLTVLGRGEFSLILATLALTAGLDRRLGPFVALYVLILAVISPLFASRSQYLAAIIPSRLLGSGWQYVRHETTTTSCAHLDLIQATVSDLDVCPQCVELGDSWVELRTCLTCGQVGCCDDSPNTHATAHFEETGHPLIESNTAGWRYCYIDQTLVREPLSRD